jgi:hypothetical protein
MLSGEGGVKVLQDQRLFAALSHSLRLYMTR